MKRMFALITALLLVAMIPMAAFAVVETVTVKNEFYTSTSAKKEELDHVGDTVAELSANSDEALTVKASDYDKYIYEGDVQYELVGINDAKSYNPASVLVIPPIPELEEEIAQWRAKYASIYLAYGPHKHFSKIWYHSLTNHWQYCDGCGEKFNMNWHHDYTDTGVCYECENPIHYYTITVKEMTGGTVTLSQEKGALNDRINVTVTPNEGYKLEEIRFFNLNEVHSQLVRYEDVPGSEYHFIILPWDIEIEADFVPVN